MNWPSGGTQSGQFDEGAVLVFDLFESKTTDNASTEGDRVLVGIMVKDSSRYTETGGTGLRRVQGQQPHGTPGQRWRAILLCLPCLEKDTDYVFSRWRD